MIPTRQQIQEKVDAYWKNHLHDPSALKSYIGNWLDEIKCPDQGIRSGQLINPRQEILDDLISYTNSNA